MTAPSRGRGALAAALVLLASPAALAEGAHNEVGFFPIAGGDTDVGVGVGFLSSLARTDPAVKPYRWRLESAGFITFKKPSGSGIESPFQDIYVLATLPMLWHERGRLDLRAAYTRETDLRYYGLGNASLAPADDVPARDFYHRQHPMALARLRLTVVGGLHALVGTTYTINSIEYGPQSNLARDLASPDPRVRSLLSVPKRAAVHLLEAGLSYDTRDNETSSTRGQFHTVQALISPGPLEGLRYQYIELNAALRFFATVWPERVVVGARLMGDWQLGDVPFFAMSRYYPEDTSALGGANGVRGIPAERYFGRLKAFGNLETRVTAFHFDAFGGRYRVGVVGFFDGGRVWSALPPARELDGTGVGLKYGLGLGLRLQKGTFLVRGDLAWSPDARPLGGYLLAGQIF